MPETSALQKLFFAQRRTLRRAIGNRSKILFIHVDISEQG